MMRSVFANCVIFIFGVFIVPGKEIICYDCKQPLLGKFGEEYRKEGLQDAEEATKVTQCLEDIFRVALVYDALITHVYLETDKLV